MRKSQIEMMGLLVIVILILLVVFFSLSLGINNERIEPKQKDFLDAMLTDGLAPVMLETSTECGFTIRELLSDCASSKDIMCGGVDSCAYANDTMEYLLDESLVAQQKKFWLSVKTSQNAITLFNDTGCWGKDERERSSRRTTLFETSHQLMFVLITLCQD